MRQIRPITLACFVSLMITSLTAVAEPARQDKVTRCIINAVTETCQVVQTTDTLVLSLDDGRALSASRLGHWRRSGKGAAAVDSCNVKITLHNDTAYGLLVRSKEKGTTLTWPQLRIEMPELRP